MSDQLGGLPGGRHQGDLANRDGEKLGCGAQFGLPALLTGKADSQLSSSFDYRRGVVCCQDNFRMPTFGILTGCSFLKPFDPTRSEFTTRHREWYRCTGQILGRNLAIKLQVDLHWVHLWLSHSDLLFQIKSSTPT